MVERPGWHAICNAYCRPPIHADVFPAAHAVDDLRDAYMRQPFVGKVVSLEPAPEALGTNPVLVMFEEAGGGA